MSYEINVVSRSQTIIVEPTSKSVSVVNEHGPPGPQGEPGPTGPVGPTGPPATGLAQDSGFERHSTAAPQVPSGGSGLTIGLNILDRESTPAAFLNYLDANVAFICNDPGVYHITGYVMSQGGTPPSAGSFVAIRNNGLVIARQFMPNQAFGSAEVSTDIWLNAADAISLFCFASGAAWNIQPGTTSAVDATSPYLRVWKHVQGPKGEKGDPGGTGVPASDSWTVPTLGAGWSNLGSPYMGVGYYKDPLGIVHLRGSVSNANRSGNIFTLPAGYVPANTLIFSTVSQDTMAEIRIGGTVNEGGGRTAGVVYLQSAGGVVNPATAGWVSLEGIMFRV